MIEFRALDETSLQKLTECFNAAFSDYEQPIYLTEESMKYYLTASAVDLSLSYGAFCGEELIALILNSAGRYQGHRVVFDAGTGVVPEHRGKGVFSGLFAYTAEELKKRGIDRYILEVLQSNHAAVAIYGKKGFDVQREYAVLLATGAKQAVDARVKSVPYGEFAAFATEVSVEPSYEHTTETIGRNPQLYEVLYLEEKAYCIHAKRNGEVIQMHYNELSALKEVMVALAEKFPKAMAKNVDFGCGDVIAMLKEIGFKEYLKQFEMALDI